MPDSVLNTTGTLSVEMKEFYDRDLLRNAKPNLVYSQFAQKKPIPKNGGKVIEFRRFKPLPKAMQPLTEGVAPTGRSLEPTAIKAIVEQYGDFVPITDMVELTAIDNVMLEANELLGNQAGETLNALTGETIAAGTNVQYCGGKEAREALTDSDVLTVADIKKAVRTLKRHNTPKKDGWYIAVIHPDVAHDLTDDPKWEEVKKYNPKDWYDGEIGRIHGVRFVESTETAKDGDVYFTLVFGKNAYGETEINGGNLKHIYKPLGSGGTSDPLEQRSTSGWKATHAAKILTEEFLVRIESKVSA